MSKGADDSGSGSSSWVWWVAGVCAGYVALRVLVQLMSDVFSVSGLLYSFGLGPAADIAYPLATRLVTWAFLLELCALTGVASNYSAGRWKDHWAMNLLLGHVTACGSIYRGLRATGGTLHTAGNWMATRALRPRVELSSDGFDDLDALVIESDVA